MKVERNLDLQTQRVDRRKGNRPKVVRQSPDRGGDGDIVSVKDKDGVSEVLLRVDDEWIDIFSEDESDLESAGEITATRGQRKSVRVPYVIAGHPRSRPTQFIVEFTDNDGNELTGAAKPTEITVTPSVPSKNIGRHFLNISFIPQQTGEIFVDVTFA